MKKKFTCHKLSDGVAEAKIIISNQDINFYLFKPETGSLIEENHDIHGKSVSNKIFAFQGGKGSSVVQADGLYQLLMNNNAPKAIIVRYPDTVLVSSAIIMEIPLVDKVDDEFYDSVQDGDMVKVNADQGYIEIL